MRLTTKGRYAVTAMLDLAIHSTGSPATLADIAERQGLSLSYLEQLFAKLRKRKLVKSVRGPGGGYQLGRAGTAIFLAEVIAAVDETVETTRCGGAHNCQEDGPCATHQLWQELSHRIYDYLNRISLQDLVDRQDVQEALQRQRDGLRIRPRLSDLSPPRTAEVASPLPKMPVRRSR